MKGEGRIEPLNQGGGEGVKPLIQKVLNIQEKFW